MLEINELRAEIAGVEILKGLTLTVEAGETLEIHAELEDK